jgi:hypothetical protein
MENIAGEAEELKLHHSAATLPYRGLFRTAKAVIEVTFANGAGEKFFVEIVDDKATKTIASTFKAYLKKNGKYSRDRHIVVDQVASELPLNSQDDINVGSRYLIKDRPPRPVLTLIQRVAIENQNLANFKARVQPRLDQAIQQRTDAEELIKTNNETILEYEGKIAARTAKTEEKINRLQKSCSLCGAPGPVTNAWFQCMFCVKCFCPGRCGYQKLSAHIKEDHVPLTATPGKRPRDDDSDSNGTVDRQPEKKQRTDTTQ